MEPGKSPRLGKARCGVGHDTQDGFSLYDLIVTSGIAGLLGFGAVGATSLVQDARLTTTVNLLMGDLNLARSESIKRKAMVVLCKSHDGMSCTRDEAWSKGWIVFADQNNNHAIDPGETLIRVQQSLEENLNLRYGETGWYHYIRYNPVGEAWPNATFSLCDARGPAKAKAVIVHWTGRPRVSSKTSDGRPLRCL